MRTAESLIWRVGETPIPPMGRPSVDVSCDPEPGWERWTHVCAWDGHELGSATHAQMSDHERVCVFHRPQFDAWLEWVRARAEGPAA